jgi:hypothetical protein
MVLSVVTGRWSTLPLIHRHDARPALTSRIPAASALELVKSTSPLGAAFPGITIVGPLGRRPFCPLEFRCGRHHLTTERQGRN